MPLPIPSLTLISAAFVAVLLAGAPARAEDIDALPSSVTFVTSTGYWEDAAEVGTAQPPRKGYYKLVAIRQADRTAKIFLQQIASTDSGPIVVSSVEVEELTQLKPFVTDIRPESSSGVTNQPGMFATVYLKTESQAKEAESWTVMIDDLGEMIVEKATN